MTGDGGNIAVIVVSGLFLHPQSLKSGNDGTGDLLRSNFCDVHLSGLLVLQVLQNHRRIQALKRIPVGKNDHPEGMVTGFLITFNARTMQWSTT